MFMQATDVNFLIIGAAKSATTWLQQTLQADPAISMPDPELHYFSRFYDRGHDWYFDQFPRTEGKRVVGEKSNSYLDTPAAAERVKMLLPHAKLIVQLRNPVERAYSDYCMLYRRGEVGGDIRAHLSSRGNVKNRFLVGGCYYEQLQQYRERFPESQMLVLLFEDMIAHPDVQIKQVRGFLGLHADAPQAVVAKKVKDRSEPMIGPRLRKAIKPLKPLLRPFRANPVFTAFWSGLAREISYPPLTQDVRSQLIDFYADDVGRLEKMLKRDLSYWLHPTSLDGLAHAANYS
jgi:hypothetical protein